MNASPLVSVVIPTYHRPEYLRLALESVKAQTYPNIEIIVQDNASPDDIAGLTAEFGAKFCRNPSNLGQTPNIVAGLRAATGKYVALLADDDLWEPEFLEKLVAPLEADPNCILAFCNYEAMDVNGELLPGVASRVQRYHGNHLLKPGYHNSFECIAMVYRSITVISGSVLRREATDWSDLPRDLLLCADIYMGYLAVKTGGSCYFCPERLIRVRYHSGTVTMTARTDLVAKTIADRSVMLFWSKFFEDSKTEWKHYYFMKRGWFALQIVIDHMRQHQWRAAWREFKAHVHSHVIGWRLAVLHVKYWRMWRRIGLQRRFIP